MSKSIKEIHAEIKVLALNIQPPAAGISLDTLVDQMMQHNNDQADQLKMLTRERNALCSKMEAQADILDSLLDKIINK